MIPVLESTQKFVEEHFNYQMVCNIVFSNVLIKWASISNVAHGVCLYVKGTNDWGHILQWKCSCILCIDSCFVHTTSCLNNSIKAGIIFIFLPPCGSTMVSWIHGREKYVACLFYCLSLNFHSHISTRIFQIEVHLDTFFSYNISCDYG